ncbi:MAG: metallophosphoesterase [Thermoanaerobaculales bacterium]|jgi:3',5'-cyclic AMP phosphodiesterase CpdA|nr:metallophosphoesterase [Thermoanaerobaculales bacterium]
MKAKELAIVVLLVVLAVFAFLVLRGGLEPETADLESTVPTGDPVDAAALAALDDHFTFLIASDLGRNGYYDQRPVAEMMGEVAEISGVEFIAALGDVHHFWGVASVHDPLWQTNFEWIYKHPELMIPWHPVLGNHEYRGNTQAVLDYGTVSRRWEMPGRYYAMTEEISDDADALLLFIDTSTLIDKYRDSPAKFPDAALRPLDEQLAWIDSTLAGSTAAWKIVMGHHPVYAGTTKETRERSDLQHRLRPLLDAHQVDAEFSGHIHNFQHIRVPGSDVEYFVNTSASLTREVVPFDGALFASPDPGFSLCSITDTELITTFVNHEGRIIYQHTRTKER